MKTTTLTFAASLAILPMIPTASAQSVATNPVGHTIVTCLPASDTIVSVPLLNTTDSISTSVSGPTTAAGTSPNNTASFTLSGVTDLTADQYKDLYYVRFTSGTLEGNIYQIASNTTSAITINLNGDSAGDIADTDNLTVYKFWTLGTLMPQETQTTAVESVNNLAFNRKTQIMLPDTASEGVNLSPNRIFFITPSGWVDNDGFGAADDTIIWPDSYMIVRHPISVTESTTFATTGAVDTHTKFVIPLTTNTDGAQDNFVAIPRPVNVKLSDLGLISSGAFTVSTNNLAFNRRDQLFVYDNTTAAINKSATAIYFHNGTNWINNDGFGDADDVELLPSQGIVIRKYQTVDGATHFWSNTPNY